MGIAKVRVAQAVVNDACSQKGSSVSWSWLYAETVCLCTFLCYGRESDLWEVFLLFVL